jgi:hypothetical protein
MTDNTYHSRQKPGRRQRHSARQLRQADAFSRAGNRAETDRVERELDRLFREFWESPGQSHSRPK